MGRPGAEPDRSGPRPGRRGQLRVTQLPVGLRTVLSVPDVQRAFLKHELVLDFTEYFRESCGFSCSINEVNRVDLLWKVESARVPGMIPSGSGFV